MATTDTTESLTACPHCGWREGDGVRACTYSTETGQRTHGNRHPVGLSPEQESLYQSYLQPTFVAWISEEDRERVIAKAMARRAESVRRNREYLLARGGTVATEEDEISTENAWRTAWIAEQHATPLRSAFGDREWVSEPFLDGRVYMYRRHVCGGHAHNFGFGYRIGCTGCDVTIQLGDHGVDEDCG